MKKIIIFLILGTFTQLSWADNCNSKTSADSISYLLLGQSNMAGQGKTRELPRKLLKQPDNVCFYLNGSLAHFEKQEKFGPEISFAHKIAATYPNKQINIIKFAPGGSLMKDWLSKGYHYITLQKQLKKITKSNPTLNLQGVLWMQGERDTKSLKLASQYKNGLIRFIKQLRTNFNKDELAFIIGKISVPEAYRPAVKQVKQAQEAVCSQLPLVKIIATDKLKKNKDNIHYSTQGQIVLGQLFANKLLTPK